MHVGRGTVLTQAPPLCYPSLQPQTCPGQAWDGPASHSPWEGRSERAVLEPQQPSGSSSLLQQLLPLPRPLGLGEAELGWRREGGGQTGHSLFGGALGAEHCQGYSGQHGRGRAGGCAAWLSLAEGPPGASRPGPGSPLGRGVSPCRAGAGEAGLGPGEGCQQGPLGVRVRLLSSASCPSQHPGTVSVGGH